MTQTCPKQSLSVVSIVPGHALHAKILQKQKNVVPLVGSQGAKSASRPGDKPLMKR